MRVINVYPILSVEESRCRQQDAARLFMNVYQEYIRNKRTRDFNAHYESINADNCDVKSL